MSEILSVVTITTFKTTGHICPLPSPKEGASLAELLLHVLAVRWTTGQKQQQTCRYKREIELEFENTVGKEGGECFACANSNTNKSARTKLQPQEAKAVWRRILSAVVRILSARQRATASCRLGFLPIQNTNARSPHACINRNLVDRAVTFFFLSTVDSTICHPKIFPKIRNKRSESNSAIEIHPQR